MNVNRRHFLTASAALTATNALGGLARGNGPTRPGGIQLYTVQPPLVHDFEGTLHAVAQIGYREVETVGLLGHDAHQFRRALDRVGLSAPSAHIVSLTTVR
jgi:hypothetical protein